MTEIDALLALLAVAVQVCVFALWIASEEE